MQTNANHHLQIGWAQTDITPDRPVYLRGQFYERISRYVHDPVTATALVLENGQDQAILVSLDLVGTPERVLAGVRRGLAQEEGLDTGKISMSATHTHTSLCWGGDTLQEMYRSVFGQDMVAGLNEPANMMKDDEVTDFLTDKLTALIRDAWRSREPGGISYALDYAAVAFNRRPVFADGRSVMYGVCSRDDFIRLEGPSDHSADMLYTWDPQGNLTGVAVNIPCPSQVMELHCYISADYWAPARDSIRERLGNIHILPICGAGGDQNPLDLIRISKTNTEALRQWGAQVDEVFRNFDMALECSEIGERISEAVERGYRKARNRIQTDAVLKHSVQTVTLPIRTVTQTEYDQAMTVIDEARKRFSPEHKMQTSDMVPLFAPVGVVIRYAEQQESCKFSFEMHVMRLGGIVFATNPFELFTEFGMRIKARSCAEQTLIAQLANSNGGYLPTCAATQGGSYSSTAASTTCGPEGGDMLVEQTLAAIAALWQ